MNKWKRILPYYCEFNILQQFEFMVYFLFYAMSKLMYTLKLVFIVKKVI